MSAADAEGLWSMTAILLDEDSGEPDYNTVVRVERHHVEDGRRG
jgi:hypothetical protein